MNEEEKRTLKVINTRTKRLLDELKVEKEDMSDEPRIAYLMQEIRANKTLLNLIERLQKENEEWNRKFCDLQNLYFKLQDESESKRKEYQETYKDVREELKEIKKRNEELKERIKFMLYKVQI